MVKLNAKKRKSLAEACSLLDRVYDIIESVCDEEADAMENCPENLQTSDRYYSMEEAVDSMNDAMESVSSARDSLDSVIN